jgi:pyridoxine 4-dehydrogenase
MEKLELPSIGCGTWAWGNRLLWGYDTSMDAQLQSVFNLCVDRGASLFDTGDSYGTGKLNGRSELLLGQFTTAYQGGNRERIVLATKLAPYPWRWTRQAMVKAGMASAARLGRNIDLVQMHWSTANYAPWQERGLLDGLGDLAERGLVRGVGLSNYGSQRLRQVHRRFQERGIAIATLQVQYSLLSTYPVTELGIKEVCDELNIRLIAYSPLCLGFLTGKYSKTNLPQGLRKRLFGQMLPSLDPLLSCLSNIATSRSKTISQVALNWCICKGFMPIPGAKSIEQATENIGAVGWQLDDNEISELDRQAARVEKPMVQNIFQTR